MWEQDWLAAKVREVSDTQVRIIYTRSLHLMHAHLSESLFVRWGHKWCWFESPQTCSSGSDYRVEALLHANTHSHLWQHISTDVQWNRHQFGAQNLSDMYYMRRGGQVDVMQRKCYLWVCGRSAVCQRFYLNLRDKWAERTHLDPAFLMFDHSKHSFICL